MACSSYLRNGLRTSTGIIFSKLLLFKNQRGPGSTSDELISRAQSRTVDEHNRYCEVHVSIPHYLVINWMNFRVQRTKSVYLSYIEFLKDMKK